MSAPYDSGGPYRARDGVIFGVCRGLARHFDLSVVGMRIGVALVAIFTGFWPVAGAYVLAALLMKPAPALPLHSSDEAEFYNTVATSRTLALQRLKDTFDRLDRRVSRIEDAVTARGYDWDRRLREGEKGA